MKLFKLNKKLMLRAFLIVHNRIKIDVNNFFWKNNVMRFFGQNEWRNGPRTRFFRFYQNLIYKSFVFYMMLQQHGGLQLTQVSCEKSVSVFFFDKKGPKMSFFLCL